MERAVNVRVPLCREKIFTTKDVHVRLPLA